MPLIAVGLNASLIIKAREISIKISKPALARSEVGRRIQPTVHVAACLFRTSADASASWSSMFTQPQLTNSYFKAPLETTAMKPSNPNANLPKVQVKAKKVFAARRISQDEHGQPASTKHRVEQDEQAPSPKETSQTQSTAAGKKRKISSVDDSHDREPDMDFRFAKRAFSYLKKHVKRLPQDVVRRNWKALPAPAQQQVRDLFNTAKRSVMHGAKDERRAREIEAALGTVLRRLEKQLPRMPFPPRAKEWMFNLDRVVERNRKLEAELTPGAHSCRLLEEAIEEEERALQRDRAALEDLRKDVKYEETKKSKENRAIHPLVRREQREGSIASDEESLRFASPPPRRHHLESIDDSELQPLLQQFKDHLNSILANKAQVEGVSEAVMRADLALSKIA